MAFLDDLKQKIKQFQQKGYLPNFSDNTSFSYAPTQNQSPNVFTPLSQTIQNIQQQASPYTKQLPQDVYTAMKDVGNYLVNTYAPAIPPTIQKIKQGKNPIQAYKETWQESEEADKQKEAKINEILKKAQQQRASLWEQSKIASQKPSFQRAMNFAMGFSNPLQPVSPEEAELMIANATKLTREDLQKITAGGEVSPEKLEAYKILTRNPETAQRLKDIATNKQIPLKDKILDYIKDLFTPSQINDVTPSRVVGELPGEVEKNPTPSEQPISEETGIKEIKPEVGSVEIQPQIAQETKPEEIIKILENKPLDLSEKYIKLKNRVDNILNNKGSQNNIPKVKEEINQLQSIISNRVDNELPLLDKLPDDLRKQYIDPIIKETVSLAEMKARLNDMATDLENHLNPPIEQNAIEVKPKLPTHYTLENVDFSNPSNLEKGQLYKVTLRSGRVKYGIYDGEGVAMDGTHTHTFRTNRGQFEVSQRGSLVLSKPQKIERVIPLSKKSQEIKPEVTSETKITPEILQQKAREALKQETQPETQPQTSQEVKSIPKELEPLAEEARKYSSAEEFENKFREVNDKLKTYNPKLTKEEQNIAKLIQNNKPLYTYGFQSLTDFYNQVTKGVQNIPSETQLKIQPQTNQETTETSIPQPETSLNAQNSPLELSNTQESINIPPIENIPVQTQSTTSLKTVSTKKTSVKSPEDVNEIKAELEKIKSGNESAHYGEVLRTYVAGERDVRIAETNQLREQLERILTPREQEALTFYRDFKGNEAELANLLNDPAFDRYKQVINLALHPTDAMLKADEAITQYYHKTLDEGRKLGFLDSTIPDEKYITHLLAPSDEDLTPKDRIIKRAKISRTTPFAKTRTYDTVADAIKAGVKVKTINALDALTIYGQKHAIAASTKLFVNQLKDSALAKWGFSGSDNIPSDWVPLDPSNKYFRNIIPFINSEGKPSFAYQDLYVPKKIAEAIKPLIETNFTGAIPGFTKTRLYQSYLKTAQLGLSAFHMRALNITALNNEGLTGLVKSYAKDMSSPEFLENEKDFIRHGGQTSILGKTIEAYKGLQDTSVPSRADILKHIPLIKQVDSFAKELSKVTFDIMQRKFKTQDYALKVSQWIAQHPNASKIELDAAKRSIAKEINAAYGGLNWEALGWSQNAVNIARFLMLAPDWTFSNFFNAKYSFEGGPGGTAARKFWIRSILTGAILTYLTSTLINGKAPKARFQNFTNVYLGKDKYGKDIFQNLFFAGAPQDAINLINNIADFGVIEGFAQSLAAKASPFIRTGIQMLTNRNYLGQQIVPRGMGPIAGTARAAYVYGSNVLPIPFSLSTIAQMFLDPKKQYTMPEYILSLMGTRPRHLVPPGMREITSGKRKGQLVPATPKVEQPLWEQITTGKQYEPIKRRKTIY